jgi:S1-C subfamily serine protease
LVRIAAWEPIDSINLFLSQKECRAVPDNYQGPWHINWGSGIVMNPDGDILTLQSVIGRASKIAVSIEDGDMIPAELVGSDDASGIAVLRVQKSPLIPVVPVETDSIRDGTYVIAMGYSYGGYPVYSTGLVTHRQSGAGARLASRHIHSTATLYPGQTGGLLLNSEGKLIGMIYGQLADESGAPRHSDNESGDAVAGGYNWLKISREPTLSLAIPASDVFQIAGELIRHGRIERGFLGIVLQREARPSQGPTSPGVSIIRVTEGSAADRAGLKVNDVILKFEGQSVDGAEDVIHSIQTAKIGQPVRLEIARQNQLLALTAIIDARVPPADHRAPQSEGYLGIQSQAISAQLANFFAVPGGQGLLVTDVMTDSPADRAAIKAGDVIIWYGSRQIGSVATLQQAIRETAPASRCSLRIVRDKKIQDIDLIVGTKPLNSETLCQHARLKNTPIKNMPPKNTTASFM